jgi:hypothetical protein
MSSPLQVVLNAENFSEDRESPGGGGPKTDFFADNDAAFVAHKKALITQLRTIVAELERQSPTFGPVGFVKVILRRKAWAKSHRPLKALFTERRTPLVGGLDIGQLIVEAIPENLVRIAQEIANAEETTIWKADETGKRQPNPTARRSETGAIESIELYGTADRRKFDLDQAWYGFPTRGPADNMKWSYSRCRHRLMTLTQPALAALSSNPSRKACLRSARASTPTWCVVRLRRNCRC